MPYHECYPKVFLNEIIYDKHAYEEYDSDICLNQSTVEILNKRRVISYYSQILRKVLSGSIEYNHIITFRIKYPECIDFLIPVFNRLLKENTDIILKTDSILYTDGTFWRFIVQIQCPENLMIENPEYLEYLAKRLIFYLEEEIFPIIESNLKEIKLEI